MRRLSDNSLVSNNGSSRCHRVIVLPDMNAIGFHRESDVGMIIDDEGNLPQLGNRLDLASHGRDVVFGEALGTKLENIHAAIDEFLRDRRHLIARDVAKIYDPVDVTVI